jgi:heme/copper-type cytochrome/quinol oxidase subunit 4
MADRNEIRTVLISTLLYLGFNAILAAIAFLLITNLYSSPSFGSASLLFIWFIAGIGLCQLVYAMPIILLLEQQGRSAVAKGVIIGAVITALLNGGCWVTLAVMN